jgi:hypothetical protein
LVVEVKCVLRFSESLPLVGQFVGLGEGCKVKVRWIDGSLSYEWPHLLRHLTTCDESDDYFAGGDNHHATLSGEEGDDDWFTASDESDGEGSSWYNSPKTTATQTDLLFDEPPIPTVFQTYLDPGDCWDVPEEGDDLGDKLMSLARYPKNVLCPGYGCGPDESAVIVKGKHR